MLIKNKYKHNILSMPQKNLTRLYNIPDKN